MCNKLKMIALLEKRLELDRRNHGKNGHHFHISAMFFSCTLSVMFVSPQKHTVTREGHEVRERLSIGEHQ